MNLNLERYFSYLAGIVVSLALFVGVLVAFRYSPIRSFETMASGAFGTTYATAETLLQMAPLLLCSLAFLVPFKARFYNIGIEGQLYAGALVAYLASSQLGGVPNFFAIPVTLLASILGGTAWLALPLLMRIKLQVNELFPTLVMNFIAYNLVGWATNGPLKDITVPAGAQTPFLPQSTWLPVIIPGTRLSLGLPLAILAAFGVFFIIYRLVLGYEIRASGSNPGAAKAGGVNVSRSILAVGILSGGLAGMAGMTAINGANHYLTPGFSPGYGYQGIGIAALGAFHPLGVVVASFLYSALLSGGENLQSLPGSDAVPIELIYVLQAVAVLSVLVVQKLISDRRSK